VSELAGRLAALKAREVALEAHLAEVSQVQASCSAALNELSRRRLKAYEPAATSAARGDGSVADLATVDSSKLAAARDAVARATEGQNRVAAQLLGLRAERRRLGEKLRDLDSEVGRQHQASARAFLFCVTLWPFLTKSL
jgi:hypothetical protein